MHALYRALKFKTKTMKLRKKRSMQLLRECWSFFTKLMTANLQNKLLNITVLFIWYLLASLKKMSLAMFDELYFILASVWKKWFPTLQEWFKTVNMCAWIWIGRYACCVCEFEAIRMCLWIWNRVCVWI
jgi:hypothetical protein